MRQVRDDWVHLLGVVERNKDLINVIVVNEIHNKVIEGDRLGVISVLNSGTDYFLILIRRMRMLFSKELPILINSQWFLHATVHEIMKCNASHSHLSGLLKKDLSDYLLSAPLIYERIEQTSPVDDKNIKSVYGITIDFLLFAPSSVPESQISTTITTLLRQAYAYCMISIGLRHIFCGYLTTESAPMLRRMGIVMSICGARGKIANEYVFVSVFMIELVCFIFDSAGISENEYCLMRQSSYFQPEGNLCDGR